MSKYSNATPLMKVWSLERPRLLMSAARFAVASHEDDGTSIGILLEREEQLEKERVNGGRGYCIEDHVRALASLLVAARRRSHEG